jgi:hypothetical protein
MKKFLGELAVFLLLQLALFLMVHRLYDAEYPPEENYYAAVIDKQRLLETKGPPRLIFIGGSATAFDVNAAAAAPAGLRPVNMGVHIGFGLPFMLAQVKPLLRTGDVVVVTPEFELFETSYAGDPEVLAYLLEHWPQAARFMGTAQFCSVLDRGMLQRAGRVVRNTLGRSVEGLESTGAIYRRSAFDANGDLDVAQFGRSEVKSGHPIVLTGSPVTALAIASLNEFHRYCESRGVRVFLSHSPIVDWGFAQNEDLLEALDARLQRELQIPILDTLQEAVFPLRQQFDTAYHMGRRGRMQRTHRLAEQLAERLQPSQEPPAPVRMK